LNDAVGLLETTGLTVTLAAVDAMEKAADVRVIQCELNDFYGVSTKIAGSTAAVNTAIKAGHRMAERLGGNPVSDVIHRVDPRAGGAIVAGREYNPLIEQDVVFFPDCGKGDRHLLCEAPEGPARQKEPVPFSAFPDYQPLAAEERRSMSQEKICALGFIETQGFTAVFEAIDTACKAANVEVVGREKLGGGYITVIIRGDVAAVNAAVEAGKAKVADLGKLISAHVIPRPSPMVLGLLPKPA
jgi:carbon dioxide concentrating mechanism protein CcmO